MIAPSYCCGVVPNSCSRLPLGLRRRDDDAGLEVIRTLTRTSSTISRRGIQIIIDVMQTFAADTAKYWLTTIDGVAAAPNDGTICIVSRLMCVEYAPDLLSQMIWLVALRVAAISSPPGW